MTMNTVTVKKPMKIAEPEQQETLAQVIRKISESMQRLLKSGLKRKAVVVLIQHDTGISQRDISYVLDSLQDLERKFTI